MGDILRTLNVDIGNSSLPETAEHTFSKVKAREEGSPQGRKNGSGGGTNIMTGPYSSLALANEFIRRSLEPGGQPLTQMQLQKLVYLAHGWTLAALGRALVEDQIEAWEFGPVYPKLYHALRSHGRKPVTNFLLWGDDTPFSLDNAGPALEKLAPDEQQIVDFVWETYGRYPAYKLSALTHQDGTPWSTAFQHGRNRPIKDSNIAAHFSTLLEPA